MSRGHAVKARCPHGSPWYVECWSCADEVIYEHRRKVVNFELAKNRIAHRMQGVHHQEYLVSMWPRGCEPQPAISAQSDAARKEGT